MEDNAADLLHCRPLLFDKLRQTQGTKRTSVILSVLHSACLPAINIYVLSLYTMCVPRSRVCIDKRTDKCTHVIWKKHQAQYMPAERQTQWALCRKKRFYYPLANQIDV